MGMSRLDDEWIILRRWWWGGNDVSRLMRIRTCVGMNTLAGPFVSIHVEEERR